MPSTRMRFSPEQAVPLVRAVLTLFFTNGLLMGAWVGALPGLRHRLHTDAAGIGLLLIVAGLGAIVSMQISGRLGDRTSARTPALVGLTIVVVGVVVVSFAPTTPGVALGALLIGCGNGSMGVAMNALGVDAESAADRRVMSRLHAMASLGGFAGAFVVLAANRLAPTPHDDPRHALWCASALAVAATAVLVRHTPRPSAHHHTDHHGHTHHPHTPMSRHAWLLGIMALFFGFTEGAAVDWSSIHVTEVGRVSPSVGVVGLLCVTLSMVSVRYIGDSIVHRWGTTTTLRRASPLAALGFTLTTACHALALVLLGWLLVGFGVALIAPQIYGLAGRLGGGRTLALVSGFGYAAFLTGPGLIGWTASHVGIQHAMAIPLLTSCLLAAMTYLPALDHHRA